MSFNQLTADQEQMTRYADLRDEISQMLLDGVPIGSSQLDNLRVFQATMFLDQVYDLNTEWRKLSH